MQIRARLIQLGTIPGGAPGFVDLHPDYDNQPTARPIRIPCSSLEDVRGLADYLYQDVMLTIAPAVDLGIDPTQSSADLLQLATDLALAMHDHRIQPGAPELAQVVMRLTAQVEALNAAFTAANLHLAALQHDVANVQHDVHDLEETLLDKHADEFQAPGGASAPPLTTLEAIATIARGEAVPAEPGVDTQVTPSWVEPALVTVPPLDDTTIDVLAWQEEPGAVWHARNNVWLLYRPTRPLSGLDTISLRDGVVAYLRASMLQRHRPIDGAQRFEVMAYDIGNINAPVPSTDVSADVVQLDLDNPYADLWLINSEAMAIDAGYSAPAGENHDDWPPLDAVLAYLGGTGCGMVRIWATWSGREVKLIAPGEPLVVDAIETPEATLRAQSQIAMMRDGATETSWAGGAIGQDGAELVTQPPVEPATVEHASDGLPTPPPEPDPEPVPDPDLEPDYWQDPNATSETQPAKRKARKKR